MRLYSTCVHSKKNKKQKKKNKNKTKKKPSSKWIDYSSKGHLQGSISQGPSSKIVNWMRGQRSNKSLILIITMTNEIRKPSSIFLTNIKLLFFHFFIYLKKNCCSWNATQFDYKEITKQC